MAGKRIIIPAWLQGKKYNQQHMNHMGIEKRRLLVHQSIYWINMNAADIEEMLKNCHKCLDFQATQPKYKTTSHEIPGRPWESVQADIITINNKYYLCIVDYHSNQNVQVKWPNFAFHLIECLVRCLEKRDTIHSKGIPCGWERCWLCWYIKEELGEVSLDRVFTCQWHLKKSAQQIVNSVVEGVEEEFLKLCSDLCTATTTTHNLFKFRIDDIPKVFPGISYCVSSW